MSDCTTCRHAVWDCDGSYDEKYFPVQMRPWTITGCDVGLDMPDNDNCDEYEENQ